MKKLYTDIKKSTNFIGKLTELWLSLECLCYFCDSGAVKKKNYSVLTVDVEQINY